ncbi:hypothetical protein IWQ61_005544 [Dispira simplex]|nr:hypothetical protein IWQ61_005544 [Dispira simplex]
MKSGTVQRATARPKRRSKTSTVDYTRILDNIERDSSSEDEIVDYDSQQVDMSSEDDASLPDIALSDSDEEEDDEESQDGEDVELYNEAYDDMYVDGDDDDGLSGAGKNPNESNREADYEKIPRAAFKDPDEERKRLPIKMTDGRLVHVEPDFPDTKDDEDAEKESVTSEKQFLSSVPTKLSSSFATTTESAPPLTKKQYLIQKKVELAELAQRVIEEPEKEVMVLKRLLNIATEEVDHAVLSKLSLLSLLAVYQDIIPDYMIRSLTSKEKSTKVTKEVKQRRQFEEALVRYYQRYLQLLDTIIQDPTRHFPTGSTHTTPNSLAEVAVQCLCELLVKAPHFNFRLNVLTTLVARLTDKQYTLIPQMCAQAIIQLFQMDESGQYSLDTVRLLTKMIKTRNYDVHEEVIKLLLHLRLRDELNPDVIRGSDNNQANSVTGKKRKLLQPVNDAGKPMHMSKKMKKAQKRTKDLVKDLELANAEYTREEKEKFHTETLKLVFVTYLRVLKNQGHKRLLPAVLEGLAKFSHLISVDYFNDLLVLLRRIMTGDHVLDVGGGDLEHDNLDAVASGSTSPRLPVRLSLLCVVTAFQLLSGQGEALNLDLQAFYTHLYAIIPDLVGHPTLEAPLQSNTTNQTMITQAAEVDSEADLLLKALEILFFKRERVPMDRAAAFAKRIIMTCVYFPPNVAAKCIALVRMLVTKYPRLDQLLSSTETLSSGIYHRELPDPDLCNPFATCMWEIHALLKHYHPKVREETRALLRQCRN